MGHDYINASYSIYYLCPQHPFGRSGGISYGEDPLDTMFVGGGLIIGPTYCAMLPFGIIFFGRAGFESFRSRCHSAQLFPEIDCWSYLPTLTGSSRIMGNGENWIHQRAPILHPHNPLDQAMARSPSPTFSCSPPNPLAMVR